ncbi:MAG: dimethyl sulfoxide reductase anchor subunit [Acidiferrobacterales bacterium]|nr:dimethyl sulfoxide reductase anchor subunit [Acidiferrobacterales bacterium]
MNPAFSVIFLTTLIGAGQGLFIATVVGAPYLHQSGSGSFPVVASLVVFTLLVAGLIASFFHLGRPERAWRAATKWRTSWLSREVIVLPMAMLVSLVYAWIHWQDMGSQGSTQWIGWIGVAIMVLLFLCTSMIYACIKFLQEWASAVTVINFTLLGITSGLLLASGLAFLLGEPVAIEFLLVGMIVTATSMMTKLFAFYRNSRIKAHSNIQTAIGIKHRHITQRSMGMTGGSFNTRAFFHHCSEKLMANMRGIVLTLVFIVPLFLLAISVQLSQPILVWIAFIVQFLGLLAERWLFFAQANHPQNLYYQTVG